jgi:hypothetical protein
MTEVLPVIHPNSKLGVYSPARVEINLSQVNCRSAPRPTQTPNGLLLVSSKRLASNPAILESLPVALPITIRHNPRVIFGQTSRQHAIAVDWLRVLFLRSVGLVSFDDDVSLCLPLATRTPRLQPE